MEDSFLYTNDAQEIHRDKMHLTVIDRRPKLESQDAARGEIEQKLFQIFHKYP